MRALEPTLHIDSPAGEAQLLKHQLALVCRASPFALRSGLIAGACVAWIISPDRSYWPAAAWLSVLLLVSYGRSWLQARYMRTAEHADPNRWMSAILAGLVLHGFVWAIPSIWLVPTDPALQTVLAILLVGVSAAAIATLSPIRHAYAALLVPFMLPIAIAYAFGDQHFRIVGAGIALYIVAMLQVGRRHHQSVAVLLQLQLDLQQQITQRERTEAELRVAKTQAESANRAKSQFLANMSHELRTPLNGMLGVAELMIREASGRQLKLAKTLRSAGERLQRIIGDILDMARIEAGALRLTRSEFCARALTTEVVELLLERAAIKGLPLEAAIDAHVPERLVSDAGRIHQVLSNLLDNAIKFTERGNIELRVSAKIETPDRALLRWEVHDTGLGIEPAAQSRLFQPFLQLDDSPTRKYGGAGLGLAISRQLVEALGGRIGLESAPGRGSVFWIEIPCDTALASATHGPMLQVCPTEGARVLVVEDNPINSELVAEMLQAAGCSVATAADGEQALAHLRETSFDLVLMDWHMPVMDGVTATRRLRELERAEARARTPVVALTASVLPGDREACEAAGMDGFLAKPFTYADLVAVLERWVARPAWTVQQPLSASARPPSSPAGTVSPRRP